MRTPLRPLSRACLFLTPLFSAAGFLSAQGTCFDGTGGPGGTFDWVVHDGETVIFDTTLTAILGGPGGAPVSIQNCINGLVDVRDLIIEEGGIVRAQGPNALRILAARDVIVRGTLDVSGFNAHDVATLNTGNQVELGGKGGPSAGDGGNANEVITSSTPRGGTGEGPFGAPGAGAQGGESGFASPGLGMDARRPGGGGGARFARDQQSFPNVPSSTSLVASSGGNGHPSSTGAESGLAPARGGLPNTGIFRDGLDTNDFWGEAPRFGPGGVVTRIAGELPGLWSGYGGGGGGNAMPASTFPTPNWTQASDEKGGPGGGGGGALHVQARGRIVFGARGQILSNGGRGGTGENTNFLNHIGGTGGAGSGGHVVLESATAIDFTDGGANAGALPRDWLLAVGQLRRTGPTGDVNPCCRAYSNGGSSSGGVVQLHVPDPTARPGTNPATTDIVVPQAIALRRFPLELVASPGAIALYLTCAPDPLASAGAGSGGWIGSGGPAARGRFLHVLFDWITPPEDPTPFALDANALAVPPRY